jgi:hypothetical protein
VALINRALAERYFAGADPLGEQLLVDDNNTGPRPMSIVGIVDNMRHVSVDGPAPFDIYIPMAQSHPDGLGFVAGSQYWVVKVATAVTDYSTAFLRTLEAIDRDVAVARVQPLGDYVAENLGARRFSLVALLGFALVALVLATIGVYGLVAYSVQRRRRELGLRLALGATPAAVTRSVVAPTLRLAMLGIAIGVGGAILTRQAVAGLLFGVTPTDPLVLGLVAVTLVVTSLVAAAIPGRRAGAIDPATILTGE